MRAQTVKHWLGLVVCSLLGIATTEPTAWAANPTPISTCPFTISTSGEYVLTKNLSVVGSCITIDADNVAIDLQGHSITGDGVDGIGIFANGSFCGCNYIIIANGKITKFATGILLEGSFSTVAGMAVEQNAGNGIELGHVGAVTDTSVSGNGGIGVHGGNNFTISNTKADYNGQHGIQLTDSIVIDSEASNNGQDGVHIDGNNGAFVAGTTANGNGGNGILVFTSAWNSVIDSKAVGNMIGIYVDGGGTAVANKITGSTANKNSKYGILLTCPADAYDNTASGNPAGNLVTSDNTCVLLDNKVQ